MLVSRYHPSLPGWLLGAWMVTLPAWSQLPANPPASAPNPEDYVKLGVQDAKDGDLDTALTTFDAALKIDPRWVPALEKKGCVLLQQNKLGDAARNFEQATQIDPTYEDAWYFLGVAQGGLADFDSAIDAFSRVINLNAKYAPAFVGRAKAHFFKGDFNGAVADTTQALAIDSTEADAFYYRGLAERALGNNASALADFQRSSDAGFAYGAYWLWIIKMESGEEGIARENLSDFLGKFEVLKDDWTKTVGDFLLERIQQPDLLGVAGKADPGFAEPCEAWFFIGMTKRLAGDVPGAQDAFQQALATGSKASVEYAEAQLELAKIPKT